MEHGARIESALARAVDAATCAGCPKTLAAALRDAVFPGGARLRPRLLLAVADACGCDTPDFADGAAAAIELLHCASLVHDDLPVFDDAALRRGRPSVHRRHGEAIAILAGDALIVLAFETLALGGAHHPARLPALLRIVAAGAGAPNGIAAGQAWESEPVVDLVRYHRTKTGALFAAATAAGAACAGADPEPWIELGLRIGAAYQLADDLGDATRTTAQLGKSAGRDAALGKPNAVREWGADGAAARLARAIDAATDAVPPCANRRVLRAFICGAMERALPPESDAMLMP